jgi:nucleoside-diphosphate-sugar epimerase
MKIFVTGGTGFIGSHFLQRVLQTEHDIWALRRKSSSGPHLLLPREPTWVQGDLSSFDEQVLEHCDAVVHLASHSSTFPYDTFSNCFLWNVQKVLELFEKGHARGVRRWIVAGSSFEYGRRGETFEKIPVTAALEPVGAYSASKAAASLGLLALAREFKVEMLIGRIFQVFGPGEAPVRLWPLLQKKAMEGEDFEMPPGDQIRDFIRAEDVANYFCHALNRQDLKPGEPIVENVGSGKAMTVKEFCDYWWAKWQATGQIRYGRLPHRSGEIMRYVPEIPSHLRISIDWWNDPTQ